MVTYFKTFISTDANHSSYQASEYLNDWLKQNPGFEIVKWQTCPVGNANRVAIVVEYKYIS